MEIQIKYPKSKCKWCGKHYTKTHNRQQYCSDYCRTEAKKEQDQKARLRWVNKNKQTLYQRQLGTRTISQHRNPDTNREQEIIQNEKQRLGLTLF